MPHAPHRTLMFIGTLAIFGLIFGLYLGWYQYFGQRAAHDMIARLSLERSKEHASLLAAQSAADALVLAPLPHVEKAAAPVTPGVAVTLSETANDDAPPAPSKMVSVTEPVAPERAAAANALLQNFWHAAHWEEKVAYVRDADRVKPLMRQYYEVRNNKDPVSGPLTHSGHFWLHDREVLVQTYASSQPGGDLDVALVSDGTGSFLIDWESYVGWGDLSFQDLKQQRPTKGQLMRVFARSDDSYHGEFSDPDKYVSVQLISADGLYYVHGFCARQSAVGMVLSGAMASTKSVPKLTLTIAYAEKADADAPVRILEVVADRWLLK